MSNPNISESLRAPGRSSRLLLVIGLAMVAVGAGAVIFPLISTLAVTLLVGGSLLLSGSILLLWLIAVDGTGPFLGAILVSLLFVGSGSYLIINPLAGAAALTVFLGLAFAVHGAFEIAFAFAMRPDRRWIVMLLSGATGLLMATLITVGWPGISAILLGLLIGMNFLTTGLGYIVLSRVTAPR